MLWDKYVIIIFYVFLFIWICFRERGDNLSDGRGEEGMRCEGDDIKMGYKWWRKNIIISINCCNNKQIIDE
jgi:hypothetical protein